MTREPLLALPPERRDIELRRVEAAEATADAFERRRRRVMWQCVALSLLGVPIYAASWGSTDVRTNQLLLALGFFISYAAPFFRWLAYHVRISGEFGS